ncbi:MAG TPA: DUF2085 domain-containing protein, partial [Ktedonobacterales bacterium]|nr:DUF2085 domain-containing protein [Ktedonobacterales bacterium]
MSLPSSSDGSPRDAGNDTLAATGDYKPDPYMTPGEARSLVAATRRNRLARFSPYFNRVLGFIHDHWLAIINTTLAVFIGIALVTPLAFAAGLTGPASGVFDVFRIFCAQTPSHSFFIAGYQTCLCSRCLAIYTS